MKPEALHKIVMPRGIPLIIYTISSPTKMKPEALHKIVIPRGILFMICLIPP